MDIKKGKVIKKIIVVGLSIALLIGLVACGSKDTDK